MDRKKLNEIRRKYEDFASKYDLVVSPIELLLVARLRKSLLKNAKGEVLEVGIGTGRNLKYYPQNYKITGIDLTPAMLDISRRKSAKLGRKVELRVMDAQKLKFARNKFNTVIDTLGLCTYPNPLKALKEMKRVCRKNGKILLLEHGISSNNIIRKLQKRRERTHYEKLACHLMRDPKELAKKAGLKILSCKRKFFGIFYLIEAMP
ncbi:MAG: methyltransferase domain-containing protein [Nanoarchaeota archaeon]|nr:methyltransferase domain-containing protein [Nanoarchaeota archaeon]